MLPFFKAYPKDIVFELRACDPQDAPLVFYLATVTWPDGGIDPQDERQLSKLRKMLGWRKDTFARALKSYFEVCEEGAGKLLPSFLKTQQSAPKSHASAPKSHASAPELQKNAPKSNKSSRANTSESESESELEKRKPSSRTAAHSREADAGKSQRDALRKIFAELRAGVYEDKCIFDAADNAQLARMLKAYEESTPPWEITEERFRRAAENYFASQLGTHTLSDLCARFSTFYHGAVDRYGKPKGAAQIASDLPPNFPGTEEDIALAMRNLGIKRAGAITRIMQYGAGNKQAWFVSYA